MSNQNPSHRLNLPSLQKNTSKSSRPLDAEVALHKATSLASGRGMVSRLLESSQNRQIKAAIDEVDHEHAIQVITNQVNQAADHRIRMIELEGEQHRTDVRDQHHALSGELAARQARKSGSAIIEYVQSNSRMNEMIQNTTCSDDDKQLLQLLAKRIAQNGIIKTSRESSGLDRQDEV